MSDTPSEIHVLNLHNENIPINRLPVEILTSIFLFVGSSLSEKRDYPYLPLSWTCRRWRAVLLQNPRFWSVVRYAGGAKLKFFDEIIHHSKSHKLDVFLGDEFMRFSFNYFRKRILNDQSRLRTLSIQDVNCFSDLLVDIIPAQDGFFLPHLENLFIGIPASPVSKSCRSSLARLVTASPRLRHLGLPDSILLLLRDSHSLHHLSHIEWLKLDHSDRRAMNRGVLKILENLPNLQILNLTSKSDLSDLFPLVITLPRLKVLSMDLKVPGLVTFEAPNLDHLSVSSRTYGFRDWALLNHIDFLKIRSIVIGLQSHGSKSQSLSIACVSGTNSSRLECQSFLYSWERGLAPGAILDSLLELPPKNSFHIPVWWNDNFQNYLLPLKRASNLNELTIDYGSIKSVDIHLWSFLLNVLRSANTITTLNITHSRKFLEISNLLMVEPTLPRLERLMYQNSVLAKVTTSLTRRMKMIQDARLEASFQPLKILELKNFTTVPTSGIRVLEKSGITIVQSS